MNDILDGVEGVYIDMGPGDYGSRIIGFYPTTEDSVPDESGAYMIIPSLRDI